jgi:type 1 fimbriae regulatory protein FimE
MSESGKVAALQRAIRPPARATNAVRRSREYLTETEVERLLQAARKGRYGPRDATAILLAYRHGLRVSELVTLRWDQVDLQAGLLHVRRVKAGADSTHPLRGPELRALRQLRRDWPDSVYVLCSERAGPMTTSNFRKVVSRSGAAARLGLAVHPHMLRHACGYKLANDGQDTRAIQHYLGHRNIQHTVRYTELSPNRFQQFWRD